MYGTRQSYANRSNIVIEFLNDHFLLGRLTLTVIINTSNL